MKLNKDTWHYWLWSNSFDSLNGEPPESTDLCHYCHRIFWQVVAIFLLLVMAVGFVGVTSYTLFYLGLYKHTVGTLAFLGVVGVGIGVLVLYVRWLNKDKHFPTEPTTLVGKWYEARKSKVCPLVEFNPLTVPEDEP